MGLMMHPKLLQFVAICAIGEAAVRGSNIQMGISPADGSSVNFLLLRSQSPSFHSRRLEVIQISLIHSSHAFIQANYRRLHSITSFSAPMAITTRGTKASSKSDNSQPNESPHPPKQPRKTGSPAPLPKIPTPFDVPATPSPGPDLIEETGHRSPPTSHDVLRRVIFGARLELHIKVRWSLPFSR